MDPGLRHKSYIVISLAVLVASGVVALTGNTRSAAKRTSAPLTEATRASVRLLEQTDDGMILEWSCPEPVLSRDEETGQITALDMAGGLPLYKEGVPELVQLSQLLDCLPGGVDIQILEQEAETRQLGNVAPMPPDIVIDPRPTGDDPAARGRALDQVQERQSWRERSAATPKQRGLWPERTVEVKEGGVFRGHRLVNVLFYPVRVDAQAGQARITKRIRVRVNLPRGSVTQNRLLDSPAETRLLRGMLGDLSPTALPTRMTEAYEGPGGQRRALDDGDVGGRVKLWITLDGITRVTSSWLSSQLIDAGQITPYDLHVSLRGQELPVHFVGGADNRWDEFDYLEFYATPNRGTLTALNPAIRTDPYSESNVYWLSWGDGVPGMRLGEEDGAWHPEWRPVPINTVRATVHLEKDTKFDRLGEGWDQPTSRSLIATQGPQALRDDHYFMGNAIDALTTRDLEMTLPVPDTESPTSLRPVVVRACLHGYSWGSGSLGHHRAVVYLNGHTERGLSAGKVSLLDTNTAWFAQSPVIMQSNPQDPNDPGISGQDLQDGDNILSVTLPGDGPAGDNDKVFANWFDIEYYREARATGGSIGFKVDETRGDTFSFDIRGFATRGIQVWKLGHSRLVNPQIRFASKADEGESYWVKFPFVSDGAYEFFVFENRATQPPDLAEWETSTRDLRQLTGAEYLMIVHDRFRHDPSLLRLDSLRRASFNGSVDTIFVSQIYEQFNDGIPSGDAIQWFLRYAYEHWPVRPTHACLIGDGVYQMRNYTGNGNMIPPIYVPTVEFGIAPSDILYGCVSGPPWDITPDIAVGRISARIPSELETYVSKLLRYEGESDFRTVFRSNFLFVADSNAGDFDFAREFSERTISYMPDNVNVTRLYLDSIPAGIGPSELQQKFRDGAVVVNYNGHGGGGVWSGRNLIDVAGVRNLTNRRGYPFITNFTCYVGAYDDIDQASVLGEAFLFSRANTGELIGGIGVYSSSGVGWAGEGKTMQRTLFDFLPEARGMTLGEIVQLSKSRHWANATSLGGQMTVSIAYCMMMMMNLLGDPGVKLSLVPETFEPDILSGDHVVARGDSFQISGTLPWDPQGNIVNLYVYPYNGMNYDYVWTRFIDQATQDTTYRYVAAFRSAKIPAFTDQDLVWTEQFIQSREFTTPKIPTPPRLVTPTGRVVVYAVDRTQERDVIGSFPLFLRDSLATTHVLNVRVTPAGFIEDDSTFGVQATILHAAGVEQVRLRGVYRPAQGPIVIDTLNLVETSPGEFETTHAIGPYAVDPSTTYRATFFVKPFGEGFAPSADFTLPQEGLPDFQLPTPSSSYVLPYLRSGRAATMSVPVTYSRPVYSRSVTRLLVWLTAVQDTVVISGGDTTVVAADSFRVNRFINNPGDRATLFSEDLELELRPGTYRVLLELDPLNQIPETRENNNTYSIDSLYANIFPVNNTLGTYYPRPLTGNVAHVWKVPAYVDTFRLRIPPGSLSTDTNCVIYSGPAILTSAELTSLRGLGLYSPYRNSSSPQVFKVMLGDSTDRLPQPAAVEVQLSIRQTDTLGLASDVALFRRGLDLSPWVRLANVVMDTVRVDTAWFGTGPNRHFRLLYHRRFTGTASGLGEFAAFSARDESGPGISYSVSGQRFTRFSFVPRHPEFYIHLSDLGGIDRGPGKFYLVLDRDTIPETEISWSDSLSSGGSMTARIEPELDTGTHKLVVQATDNSGNATLDSAQFEVRGDFGIEWAINYPNPFRSQTTISYLLTDVATDLVEVRIYTVAGRHIRTLRELDRSVQNYRSLVWDGRDDRGSEVANGVYFARIKAKHEQEAVETTVKLAKVR